MSLQAADFDTVFIGSSPFSLLEAIYRTRCGEKVLILEANSACGGAWQSVDVCGIQGVDMGCHSLNADEKLTRFLEKIGVELQDGYFKGGCHAFIGQLLKLYEGELRLNCKAGKIVVGKEIEVAGVTTKKLVLTPMSEVVFEGAKQPQSFKPSEHHHIYLRVEGEVGFRYLEDVAGAKRAMYSEPLLIIQTHDEPKEAEHYLKALGLNVQLIDSETRVFRSGKFNEKVLDELRLRDRIEVLQTGVFYSLVNYVDKWEKVF